MSRYNAEYVLPLRWSHDADTDELTGYLHELSERICVTVVDGSPAPVFAQHRQAWGHLVRHLPPQPWPGRNGKVRNVVTGLRAARHEKVIIVDDDVRYDARSLGRVLDGLESADAVVPQNVFDQWPWHARWDTARQLLNRAFGADYPGTMAVRRGLVEAYGYDGDVLFENLQLIRTVRARGGVVRYAPDIYVARRPPTTRHFLNQRVRQAYDDFAQPPRLIAEALLLPLLFLAVRSRSWSLVAAAALAATAAAQLGRARHGGSAYIPASTTLWAPVWLTERAVCLWAAIALRVTGGIRYSDGVIRTAATRPSLGDNS